MGLTADPRLFGYTETLTAFADRLDLALATPVHKVYLPVGYLAFLHAIRVSHATRQVSGGLKSKFNVYQGVLLNQILLFGGVVLSSLLLGLPCPMFASGQVILLYAGTHLALTLSGLGDVLLQLNDNYAIGLSMDIFFSALDGLFRADGVLALGVDIVRTHPSVSISSSSLAAIVNGAIIGGATPLLIDLFRLDSASGDWSIRTPKWIKDPFAGTQDLVSGAVVSAAYLAMIDKGFAAAATPYLHRLTGVASIAVANDITLREAKTISAVLMTSILVAQRLAQVPAELAATSTRKPAAKKGVTNGSMTGNGAVGSQKASNGNATKKSPRTKFR
ncbi:hypothetical protein ACQY0O_001547 [Thecaphora frezii]